jgi:hypothetical protein
MSAIFKVIYISDLGRDDEAPAVCGILANAFAFCQLSPREFLVRAPPSGYGGEREMLADLNEHAVGGRYRVIRLAQEELDALGQIEWR